MSETPRLKLGALASDQSQKHVIVNKALVKLDALVDLHLLDRHLTAPPAAADGDAYLVAAGATDDWSGQDHRVAYRIDGGWRFYDAFTGLRAYVVDENALMVFDGAGWVDFSAILGFQSVQQLGINTVSDLTNRLAVKSSAVLFAGPEQASGGDGDIQFKIVKEGAGDTASLLFQTDYSGRAEMGLAGSDDFAIKVSADGLTWHTALSIDRATGAVDFPNGGGGLPAGAVIWHAAQTPPSGFLVCDGSAKSRTDFAALFAAIGTTYGVGDGSTTFNVPDLRGEFIRGWDDGRGVDGGRLFGSGQGDAFRAHTHQQKGYAAGASSSQMAYHSAQGTGIGFGATAAAGDAETRPRNVALLPCIKH